MGINFGERMLRNGARVRRMIVLVIQYGGLTTERRRERLKYSLATGGEDGEEKAEFWAEALAAERSGGCRAGRIVKWV